MNCRKICDSSVVNREVDNCYHKISDRWLVIFEDAAEIRLDNDFQAVYIAWMCVAPQNNKMLCDYPKYTGAGGHLFAIAADKFMDYEWTDEEI